MDFDMMHTVVFMINNQMKRIKTIKSIWVLDKKQIRTSENPKTINEENLKLKLC